MQLFIWLVYQILNFGINSTAWLNHVGTWTKMLQRCWTLCQANNFHIWKIRDRVDAPWDQRASRREKLTWPNLSCLALFSLPVSALLVVTLVRSFPCCRGCRVSGHQSASVWGRLLPYAALADQRRQQFVAGWKTGDFSIGWLLFAFVWLSHSEVFGCNAISSTNAVCSRYSIFYSITSLRWSTRGWAQANPMTTATCLSIVGQCGFNCTRAKASWYCTLAILT